MGNKSVKKRLIQLYGPQCFIEKLHLRHDTTPRHYTSSAQMRQMKQLTYHHIKEKRNGGTATVENGALLSMENHQWFNEQPPEVQAELNRKFQEYKECFVELTNNINPRFEIKTARIIPTNNELLVERINVYEDMTPEEIEIYKKYKKERYERILKKFEREER